MRTIFQLTFIILSLQLITGCSKEYKPEFKSVLEQSFSGVNKKVAKYSAFVVFENKGDKSFTIENLIADLKVDGNDACTIYFNDAMEIKPGSEVKIPVRQSFDTKGVFVEGSEGFSKTVKTELKGELKLKSSEGENVNTSFFHSESVKITIRKEERDQEAEQKKLNRKEKRAERKEEK